MLLLLLLLLTQVTFVMCKQQSLRQYAGLSDVTLPLWYCRDLFLHMK